MAEVDILGLSFDPSMALRMIVGECKDRKGATKEADRIIWLLGLRQTLRAGQALFAKPNVADAVYTWAPALECLVWDEASVQAIEKRYGLEPTEGYFGAFNPDIKAPTRQELFGRRKAVGSAAELVRAVDYVRGAHWYTREPTGARRIHGFVELLSDVEIESDFQRERLYSEAALALLFSALSTGAHRSRQSPERANAFLRDAFASGVAPASALRDLAARADDYYRDILFRLARQAGTRGPVNPPRLTSQVATPPNWLEQYLIMSDQAAAHPSIATDALRLSEMVLFEQLLLGGDLPPAVLSKLVGDPVELLRPLQWVVQFMKRIWGVQSPLLDEVLSIDRSAFVVSASVSIADTIAYSESEDADQIELPLPALEGSLEATVGQAVDRGDGEPSTGVGSPESAVEPKRLDEQSASSVSVAKPREPLAELGSSSVPEESLQLLVAAAEGSEGAVLVLPD